MRRYAIMVSCVMLVSPAVAAPITYTLSGSFSGTFGATSFVNKPTTIVGSGDTTGVVSTFGGALLTNPFSSLVITVAGIGTTAVSGFNDIVYTDLGFSYGVNGTSVSKINQYFASEYPPAKTYDLVSNLGPVAVTLFNGTGQSALTDVGTVFLSNVSDPVTFAAAVPEPGSLTMLAVGLVGALIRRRRLA